MSHAPWFPLYVKDWAMGTASMTDAQAGAFMRLLCHAWEEDGLPDDERQIQAMGRWTPKQWAHIWPVVGQRFVLVGNKRRNIRQEEERSKAGERSETARKKVQKRWAQHNPSNTPVDTAVLPRQYDPQSQSQPQSQEREHTPLSLVAREATADLSPGQLQAAASGLFGAWNALGEPFTAITARSHPKATKALHAHPDLDWWAALFARVAASDFLRRDAKIAPADLWWVLDHVEEIAAGRYDNRAALSGNEAVLARVLRDLA